MNPNIFASLDLEMNQPSGKIIQVGYVIGNIETGAILLETEYNIKIDEPLDPRIILLTGITEEDQLAKGITLPEAYEKLKEYHTSYGAFRNCLTWGGGDSIELKEQLAIKDDENFLFGRRWIDVKTVYLSYQIAKGNSMKSGLAKSLTKMGINFKGKKHTAKDDAKNTFIMYVELLKRLKNAP